MYRRPTKRGLGIQSKGDNLEAADVGFGSLADICSAKGHVRFAPNSDRESEFPQTVVSALPPKADICGATRDVRFGPIADIARLSPLRWLNANLSNGKRPRE